MKLDLEDLERKARAAEQSAWTTDDVAVAIVKAEGGEQIADTYDNTPWPDRLCVANARYIAAASPPVVLALIARIRSLQAFVDALPDESLQALKLYRDQVPELYTDEDGNALYMDEAKRRILERGTVLP